MTLFAQNHTTVCAAPYIATPLGYQQILAAALAAATPLTVPANAQWALIEVEGTFGTEKVRYRDDGVAPTSTVGMLLPAVTAGTGAPQAPIAFYSDLTTLQFIAAGGAPILNISYYR